jgi:hypothetical protein
MTEVAIGIGATILAAGLGYAGYSLYKKRKTDNILRLGKPVNVNIALPTDANAHDNADAIASAEVVNNSPQAKGNVTLGGKSRRRSKSTSSRRRSRSSMSRSKM